METFALRYLGLDGDQIQTISDSRRENKEGFKFDILEHWRNRNPGPNARAVGMAVVVGEASCCFNKKNNFSFYALSSSFLMISVNWIRRNVP